MKPVFFESVIEALQAGFETGHNVLLYGPPGHNKSNGAEWFLKQAGIPDAKIFIKSISGGTTIEDMYGGVDLKLLQKDGEIKFRLDSPDFFGNHEYVIFDEILDAKERVLASLKDTLMAREVRNGSQRKKLATKMVIGLTNVDAKDFEDNWERAAILERFPIRVLVKWDEYSPHAFETLLEAVDGAAFKKHKDFAQALAGFAAQTHMEGKGITPRTVVQAFMAAAKTGKEAHGWIIAGTEAKSASDVQVPREVVFKWTLSRITARVSDIKRKHEFDRLVKVKAFLANYLIDAPEDERSGLKAVVDDIDVFLNEKLMQF